MLVEAFLRMEIACFLVIALIAWMYFSAKRRQTYVHKLFSMLIVFSALNLVFDIITIYTVNNLDIVPTIANELCHRIFLASFIAIIYVIFLYMMTVIQKDSEEMRTLNRIWVVPLIIGVGCTLFLPIHFEESINGNFSDGPAVLSTFVFAGLYLIVSILFFFISWRQINPKKRQVIVAAMMIIASISTLQFFFKTLLMSGAGVTIMVLTFFFTLESPDVQLIELLEDEKERANAANNAKTSFLANMSHEIRTPINAIIGLNEVILRDSTEPQTLVYARDIQNAGKTLLSIVNDILDFSKIEAGKTTITPAKYQLSSVLNDLVTMTSFRAANKGLALNVNIDPDIPNTLFGDETRIKQIILNVLTNAIKYTEQGSVTFTVNYEKKQDLYHDISICDSVYLKVRVVDTGIGIKANELDKLFSPFERIDENRNRTIEGTGLGMSIVKKLLAMMDSELIVQSEYGKGSDFSFSLLQKVMDWTPLGKSLDITSAVDESSQYHESFHAPDAHILVVDDTNMNLLVIKGLLKPTQLAVDTAESGKELLKKVTEQTYDIIFLDHRMPGMDGIEAFKAMKTLEHNQNKRTPIIALTANAISGSREFYLKVGFNDYISKPIDSARLEQLIVKYLPKRKVILPKDKRFNDPPPVHEENTAPAFSGGILQTVTGVDIATGIKNCGSEDMLLQAMQVFLISIDEKTKHIEEYAASGDFKNYTILVHSLKSSARLIGAMELSQRAAYLEQCGDASNAVEIAQLTPSLLELLNSYKKHLAPLAKPTDTESSKPIIEADALHEALQSVYDFTQSYDWESVDDVLHMLDTYRIPEDFAATFEKIRVQVAAVNRDELLKLIQPLL